MFPRELARLPSLIVIVGLLANGFIVLHDGRLITARARVAAIANCYHFITDDIIGLPAAGIFPCELARRPYLGLFSGLPRSSLRANQARYHYRPRR